MPDKKIEVKKDEEKDKKTEIALRKEYPSSLFQRFDRAFDEMRRDFGRWLIPDPYESLESVTKDLVRSPLSNIEETDKYYRIRAEMPGIDKEDVKVSLDGDRLEIKGETKGGIEEIEEREGGNIIRREYRSSSFYRCFTLPENTDQDKIDATFEKGVLSLTIPKIAKKEQDKKKIPVK